MSLRSVDGDERKGTLSMGLHASNTGRADLSTSSVTSAPTASLLNTTSVSPTRTVVEWVSLGRRGYEEALSVQNEQASRVQSELAENQLVYAVEHPPTITIGKNGSWDNIVASRERLDELGFQVFNVDRGGDVTYHGPGQLVVYPVLHLGPWQNDVSKYVRMLEDTVILALGEVGIEGRRLEGYPGVWVGEKKVCAIGARVKKRRTGEFVTAHGLALNVATDLSHFQTIIPCGIVDKGVTSVSELLAAPADWLEWEKRIQSAFGKIFNVSW